ncbi:ROK family protein [Spiroplasma cantharicola]|uniref:Transcriptional regulator/sugar kinase n=1 Tax=Spiroplasma cantharicola TaxID=362837 RepID=A0A0M5KGZ3_9MOLU|nr:ROK family protein [Spiroplasma cantharicola]ALD66476.1 transcriptional regulator/sugar kinase [Spiroplasma cantharicola]
MYNYCFDIGGTSTKCIIFKNNKVTKSFWINYTIASSKNLEDLRTSFVDVLSEISKVLDQESEKFNLAICLPGIIDTKNKRVLSESAIKDVDIDLIKYFSKYSKLNKFVLLNDAKAAVLGEYNERIKNNSKIINMIHLTIGTAIGCGIIINRELFNGNTFQAGEIGKMYSSLNKTDPATITFDTGMGTALIKYLMRTGKKITGEEFFELYNSNDKLVIEMMDDFTSHLAKLIINLNYILDFDLLTIGGGVSSNEQFIEMIKQKLTKHKNFYWDKKLMYTCENIESKFDVSILKNQAACYGGLYFLTKEEKNNE